MNTKEEDILYLLYGISLNENNPGSNKIIVVNDKMQKGYSYELVKKKAT